jgi:hypothetical protein
MNGLPRLLLAAPRVFYGLAVFYVGFEILLPLLELNELGYSTAIGTDGSVGKFMIARLIGRAAYDALFIVGMGVSAQLLIAIWRNTRRPEPGESGE